jgi:hypothetical protein
MLTLLGSPRRCCDGITRRETLKAGALSALGGLALPQALGASEAGPSHAWSGKAKNVIVLYLLGGAATQDMYDMKPLAPAEVRGEFKPISSTAPGVEVCEHLPRLATWMHKAAVVRSVNHKAGCHNSLPSYSGFEQPLDNIVSTKSSYPPGMGSICEFLSGAKADQPAYIYMPCYLGWGQSIRRPGPYGGFLGARYDPLFTECKPYVDNPPDVPYKAQPLRGVPYIPHTALGNEISLDRLNLRKSLLAQLDDERYRVEGRGDLGSFNRHEQRAWSLLTSSKVREAFNLEAVDRATRDRYGNILFGQSALVARRLVEAGVRFVNVTWDCYWERLNLQFECWDTHASNFSVLKNYNLPCFDMTASALLDDLSESGLLDETLIVVLSEMGRTPRVNGNAGRDHWTFCYSVLFLGAGIKGGTVYGASDAQAAYPAERPVSTAEICATVYQCLGIDPEMLIHDQAGRPVPIAHGARPIEAILA